MKLGRKLADWLNDIAPDQNLNEIDDLLLNAVSGKRRWWARRDLSPTLPMGVYDPDTGKYVLGTPSEFYTWESLLVDASTEFLILTCPAGYRLEIYQAAGQNNSRNSNFTLELSVAGEDLQMVTAYPGLANMVLNYMFGNISKQYPQPPLGLSPGDSSEIKADTFVVGDDTMFWFYYKQFVLV